MAGAIHMDMKGLEGLLSKLQKMSTETGQRVDDILEGGAMDMAATAKGLVPKDEGFLNNAIQSNKVKFLEHEFIAQKFYAPFIEFGTKGRVKVPKGWEDVAEQARNIPQKGGWYEFALAILEWMKRKGIRAGVYNVKTRRRVGSKEQKFNEDVELAERIAFAILKKGIKPQPFFVPAYNQHKDKIIEEIKKVITGG